MGRPNGTAPRGYTKLTRSDLKAWDTRAYEIIRDAQDMGWEFRVSTRGHAIGRSPDGKTTMSVANRYDSKRTGANARAEFERWKKAHESKAAIEKKVRGVATNLIATMARDLVTEYADKYPNEVPEPIKVVFKRMCDNNDVAVYLADRIAAGHGTPLILTYDLDSASAEITNASKPWRIQWVMADPDDHRVIGFGGPQLDAESAQDVVTEHLAMQAKAKALAKQRAIDAATPAPRTTPLPVAPSMRKKDNAVKMYACTVEGCDAVFEQPASLASHTNLKHQAKVACQWCGQEFSKSSIRGHEPACQQNPGRNATYECGRCEGVYKLTGRGRHEGTCKVLSPEQLAEKRAFNRRKRGLDLPIVVSAPEPPIAAGGGLVAPLPPAPQGGSPLAAIVASLPHVADPLSALMNLLAEVEELRASGGQNAQEQIAALTVERDNAIKRAEEAEGKLATLRSVFG